MGNTSVSCSTCIEASVMGKTSPLYSAKAGGLSLHPAAASILMQKDCTNVLVQHRSTLPSVSPGLCSLTQNWDLLCVFVESLQKDITDLVLCLCYKRMKHFSKCSTTVLHQAVGRDRGMIERNSEMLYRRSKIMKLLWFLLSIIPLSFKAYVVKLKPHLFPFSTTDISGQEICKTTEESHISASAQ